MFALFKLHFTIIINLFKCISAKYKNNLPIGIPIWNIYIYAHINSYLSLNGRKGRRIPHHHHGPRSPRWPRRSWAVTWRRKMAPTPRSWPRNASWERRCPGCEDGMGWEGMGWEDGNETPALPIRIQVCFIFSTITWKPKKKQRNLTCRWNCQSHGSYGLWILLRDDSNIAGWKMDADWRCNVIIFHWTWGCSSLLC